MTDVHMNTFAVEDAVYTEIVIIPRLILVLTIVTLKTKVISLVTCLVMTKDVLMEYVTDNYFFRECHFLNVLM